MPVVAMCPRGTGPATTIARSGRDCGVASPRPAGACGWPGAIPVPRRLPRAVVWRRPAASSLSRVPVPLTLLLMIRRICPDFTPRKNPLCDVLQPVQALAQARTDRFGVHVQFLADFLVAQIAEIPQL